ncbi:MAG TPA: HAD-IC family P-type ATPase [Miltoncostaeaceae bacterium]|nr:HAD-IC family P-type ATPase [Miltoncostaeaceae bacterium]
MHDTHQLTVDEAAALVASDAERGLTGEEVARRREVHGPNTLPGPRRRGPLRRLAAQFHNPLIYVLVAAAGVTAAIGDLVDTGVIAGVVLVNAVIGFVQESRAERALQALMSIASTRATVVRDGRRRVVDSAELVPGDLVHLEAGDRVPADVRLAWVRQLGVDESMLTGESVPVDKRTDPLAGDAVVADRLNMAFAGTLVTTGGGTGLVVATGADTELGAIHRLVGEATEIATPLTRRIAHFGRFLTAAILVLAALTFVLGLARGEPAADMFTAAVALAVAAIPEGLPAAVTIALALGVSRMARRRAIVRRLPAAETLGSTTVICSDKTGTLTENRMTVRRIWAGGALWDVAGDGYGPEGAVAPADPHRAPHDALRACLEAAALCTDARLRAEDGRWEVVGDPTEGALLAAARRGGVDPSALREGARRRDVLPFSSERGWMATLDDAPQGAAVHVKGGVERILERSAWMRVGDDVEPLDRDRVLDHAARLAEEGLRVLAIARAPAGDAAELHEDDIDGLTLLGLQGMLDPPRAEAVAAVAACRRAGIAVKMVTGDQLETARSIARRVGLARAGEPVALSGVQLQDVDAHDLPDVADATDVFARVSPEQKLRLVRALQGRGHVVAMTGDGVNDAPALRQADLGIAMGRDGTEVAKEAGDIVLADDDFATIAAAVEEGRRVFDNITKFIVWTLPTNLGQGLVIIAAIVFGATLPILPTQILWINMITAVGLGLMLAWERLEPDAMSRPPRDPAQPLLTRTLLERMALVGVLLLAGSFGLFALERHLGTGLDEARTVAATVFVVGQAFYLLNCRSLTRSFLSLGAFSNRWLVGGVTVTLALQLMFAYAPFMQALFATDGPSADAWLRILAVGAGIALVIGAEKRLRRRGCRPPRRRRG